MWLQGFERAEPSDLHNNINKCTFEITDVNYIMNINLPKYPPSTMLATPIVPRSPAPAHPSVEFSAWKVQENTDSPTAPGPSCPGNAERGVSLLSSNEIRKKY